MQSVVIFCLCFSFAVADHTYRAGVLLSAKEDLAQYTPVIHEASNSNVDILLLPTKENDYVENFDETVKILSELAKRGRLYVIANLNEEVRCDNRNEHVRTNLVLDREGAIVLAYRKSFKTLSNCTSSSPDMATFTTDFGVTFGLFMEDDLILRNPDELRDVNNFIVTGSWSSEVPVLSAGQFSSSWAYVNKANVISNHGINSKSVAGSTGELIIADLKKTGVFELSPPVSSPVNLQKYPEEDLSQYTIKPLNLEASNQGYKETVCHNKFCCEFYVKTNSAQTNSVEINYGLAAFDGVRRYGHNQYIGVQNCAIFACAGLYKRSCAIGSNNSTDIHFEKITVTGNFTEENSKQFPMIVTTSELSTKQFQFTTKSSKQVSAEIAETTLLSFGITGRVYSRDYESYVVAEAEGHGLTSDIYEYFFNEDTQEFFDYVSIRVRILAVVVSIYILEMM